MNLPVDIIYPSYMDVSVMKMVLYTSETCVRIRLIPMFTRLCVSDANAVEIFKKNTD